MKFKIGFLTAGGIAPCLSSSICALISEYNKIDNIDFEFIGYLNGYKGLLTNNKINITNDFNSDALYNFGGSFLGNSRVKLTNIEDCEQKGYIKKGQDPLEVAANQLKNDKIDILHTIGGDDTNTTAGDLVDFLSKNSYTLKVIGMPKTIDNDVYPIEQTLGAVSAAEQTKLFFENIVNENTTSTRQLIIHEVMGRNCGWLTAYSAFLYTESLKNKIFIPEILVDKIKWGIHGIYIPEINYDFKKEFVRLRRIMDKYDCVNIFFSEGAGLDEIIKDMKSNNKDIKYDAFGHVRLDEINPGQWFSNIFKKELDADKVLVQKSGYFSRSAKPNKEDLKLIKDSAALAVKYAIKGNNSGVIGLKDKLELIDFNYIRGGKPFDYNVDWFKKLTEEINQID
tara:strand:+ start:1171 stop:2358 length:1188 start_codon:yes stop_codon:yes gene_type:complete